jgi:hypothetical protein
MELNFRFPGVLTLDVLGYNRSHGAHRPQIEFQFRPEEIVTFFSVGEVVDRGYFHGKHW